MVQRTRNIRNAYDIVNTRGDLITTISERTVDTTSTSLALHGRGYSPYGLRRNENIVHLVENFANTTPPNNPIPGQFWWKENDGLYVYEPERGSPAWITVVPASAGIGFSITPGDGFDQTSGGLPTGSPLVSTISLSAGRGFQFISGGLAIQESTILHDNLSGFVANEHLDHSSIVITGGAGFVGGSPGFPISSNVSLNVGAGKGISVGTTVGVNSNVWRTFGDQTVTHTKSFTGRIRGNNTSGGSVPSFGFDGDTNTGMYYILGRSNEISFSTGSIQRFRMESGGVLRALATNYETLLTDPHDIPNKKYVDGVVGASSNPTATTHVGTSSISGLDGNLKYLVHVYGRLSNKGNVGALLSAIRLRRGSTTLGSGSSVASTPTVSSSSFNWFDGAGLSGATFICDMSGDTSINGAIEDSDCRGGASGGCIGSRRPASYMTAIQLTDPPPVGSPIVSSGTISLASTNGDIYWGGFIGGPSAIYDGLASWQATSAGVSQGGGGDTTSFLTYTPQGSDWLLSGSSSDFEIKAETSSLTGSGITAIGTTGSWLSLSSTRTWTLVKDGAGFGLASWVLDIIIRDKVNPANQVAATISLSVLNEP